MLQYYTCMQYTDIQKTHTYTRMWANAQRDGRPGKYIAQNRPDNFPSYPPDNHNCSDDVCLRDGSDVDKLSAKTSQVHDQYVFLHIRIFYTSLTLVTDSINRNTFSLAEVLINFSNVCKIQFSPRDAMLAW